ncbi:Cell division protein FtsK [Enhygromyxa salina]|uniref:Cell division protein FtsK n=1 Tax=Enhygromyxa salina TaxID=215803 RepID=A0A0C1ZNP2_9BACT|nr:FtsK/SpoIIIE domain-containing protein [Enhygromyxa salina]KIG19094.1 Cell division protein FtsK [Enhygromyxa salina]
MNTKLHIPVPFGESCCRVFLRRVCAQGQRTSNRHIVDYLPPKVAEALHAGLIEVADNEVSFDVRADNGEVTREVLAAIPVPELDAELIAILVVAEGRASTGTFTQNTVTEGFASYLRDHYVDGADRHRFLVTITAEGNETQKSAQDLLADSELLSLGLLLQDILAHRGLASSQSLCDVASVYHVYNRHELDWQSVTARFERYIDEVADAPTSEQGAKLPMLGCFLPDASQNFVDGERIHVLEKKDQLRRERGASRLFDNAMVREFLEETLNDPLVDPEPVLREVLPHDHEKANKIANAGPQGLSTLDAGTFVGQDNRKRKRTKLRFEVSSIDVVGAQFFRVLGTDNNVDLIVTANSPFRVDVEMSGEVKDRQTPQLITWNDEKNKPLLKRVIPRGTKVRYEFEAPSREFQVMRLALASGPRAMANPYDTIDLAVYAGDCEQILVEEARQLSLEDQAWIVRGETSFELHHGDTIDRIVPAERTTDEEDEEDLDRKRLLTFSETPLSPQVVEYDDTPAEEDETSPLESLLELAAYEGQKPAPRTRKAFADADHYLDAVRNISQVGPTWRVDLQGGVQCEIQPAGRARGFVYEHAVELLLGDSGSCRVEKPSSGEFRTVSWGDGLESLSELRRARAVVFAGIGELAKEKISGLRTAPGGGVPLSLLPLHRAANEINEYLAAWTRAARSSLAAAAYSAVHDALLQLDTLRLLDDKGRVERLVVVPTHPWLLGALLAYQSVLDRNLHAQGERYPLTRGEVDELVPRSALEDWHLQHAGNRRLRMTDAAPFHFEFKSKKQGEQADSLGYISRIVATKLERYLEMHPHLRDERRTLRLGFVNPGDGRPFLAGLHAWLRALMPRNRQRILPLEQIPAIDVLFFSTSGQQDDEVGSSFEEFFKAQIGNADEDVVRQTLLGRLRYRRCQGSGPAKPVDGVHLCFARGLVDSHSQDPKTGLLADGWDGAFGDGLLTTYLRRTLPGVSRGEFTSRRGLWVPPESQGLRGALAAILALQRACKDSDPSPEKALFWDCRLPNLASMAPTYEHSDWVVHLDRELSLELFEGNGDENTPTIIEYSDQEVPQSPGFDTITATTRAEPYYDQLSEMLSLVGMDMEGREQDARDAAHDILSDINALSGSWALDFLVGSLADKDQRTRLMGNIGAALAYRWLRRVEGGDGGGSVIKTSVGDVVPVFISLEELIRATPAARLKKSDGLIHRYRKQRKTDDGEKWCDDILVMYLTKTEDGQPSRLYGRIVEVKFGRTILGARDKAVAQVKGTNELFRSNLGGGNTTVDAPFKNKLLSLLLKAQLEQAVAMGALSRDVYKFLNIPAFSTNLATSNYTVDYMIGADGQNLFGDAFLLYTGDSDNVPPISTRIQDGVRVVTLGFKHVEWLAFNLDNSPTLVENPASTLPRLGRYTTVQTSPGKSHVTTEASREADSVPEGVAVAEHEDNSEPEVVPAPPEPAPVEKPSVEVAQEDVADVLSLKDASDIPVKMAPYPDDAVLAVTKRLEQALNGHKIRVAGAPSAREVDRGPRLLRAYVRLEAGESINSVRRCSEDIARVVGTEASDIHISNVPERHSIALDLPVAGMSYAVDFGEVYEHASFRAARAELQLGFCAGIDVTGRALWADLAEMPHMLVAGTTGSGKTVFLRGVILTLLLSHSPKELEIHLSSSKPMDFKIFTKAPHSRGRAMASDPGAALALAEELVSEMDRRIQVITDAFCDNLAEFNEENPRDALPYVVGVFDEYSAMILSFTDKADRSRFEAAIGHLAQKARAAGIHLIICMQRPDAAILKGAIKANILHRFALKLPQNQDSRVILDENGAETLLGKGDLLYKDGAGRLNRLQVPYLDNRTLKGLLPR